MKQVKHSKCLNIFIVNINAYIEVEKWERILHEYILRDAVRASNLLRKPFMTFWNYWCENIDNVFLKAINGFRVIGVHIFVQKRSPSVLDQTIHFFIATLTSRECLMMRLYRLQIATLRS